MRERGADAVARWHLKGDKHQEVVRKALSRWLKRDSVETKVEHRNAHSTAVLAVAKILDLLKQKNDPSFPSYLEGLLQQLAKDPNERSRYHFREKIIPALERRQLPIASEFLYALAYYSDMHNAIVERLVTVVDEGGEDDVLDLLEVWQRRPIEATIRGAITCIKATELFVQLSVFLLCSGPVRNADRFLELIRVGLKSTDALEVKLGVLYGIRFGLSQDPSLFAQVDEVVRIFLRYATIADRDALARVLGAVYNEQHQQAAPPVNGLIDDLIYTWIADPRSPVAQRTALRSVHYIAKGLTVSASNVAFDPPATPPALGLFATIKRSYSEFYLLTLAPLIGTLGQPSLRRVVRGLMPEALLQFRKNKGDFDQVLTRMYQANHRNSRAIVRALDKALAFADVQSYVTALMLIIPLVAVCIWFAWQYL